MTRTNPNPGQPVLPVQPLQPLPHVPHVSMAEANTESPEPRGRLSAPDAERPHVLLIDDEARLRGLVARGLTRDGFLISQAGNTAQADALLEIFRFDLLVVDVMMPGEDGLAFVERLRQTDPDTPLLMLSALGEASDRVRGLAVGVDDYLVKPFDPKELTLRLRAILRRRHPVPSTQRFGTVWYDPATRLCRGPDGPIALPERERRLFALLAASGGKVCDRTALARALDLEKQARTVDRLVARLRKRLAGPGAEFSHLHAVRGSGYRLVSTDSDQVGLPENGSHEAPPGVPFS